MTKPTILAVDDDPAVHRYLATAFLAGASASLSPP